MSYERIKRELLDDDEDTRHLSAEETDDNEGARVDRKPLIVMPGMPGFIELSSDEDVIVTPSRKRRKKSSFYIRLVVKEVATQTDDTKTADAGINTDNVTTSELGVNTDEPAKTIEVGVITDAATNDNTRETTDNDMEVDDDNHEGDVATTSSTRDHYYQCKVCSCYYLCLNLFQKHSQTQHNRAVSVDHKKVAYNSKCRFCSANYVFITYNKHIKTKHSDKFWTKGNNGKRGKDEPYICTVCKDIFLSYNEGKRHRKVHSGFDQKFILRKLKVGDAPNTPGVKAEEKKTKPLHRAPIPKSMLFQCPKCQLNFFTYRSGFRHTIACKRGENTKGIAVNCSKCDRKFISGHIRNHNVQHQMTNEFKICPIEERMEHRILYRCMKCNICMEERSCNIHFQNGCHRSTGVPCTICHVKIDRDLMSKHKNAHGCMGITKEQFILVDIL